MIAQNSQMSGKVLPMYGGSTRRVGRYPNEAKLEPAEPSRPESPGMGSEGGDLR